MTVRVGVVGAGVMGADHVRLLHGHVSDAEVVAVTDVDEARSRAVADAVPGARVSPNARALIADPGVDAVVIASHDSTHAELTVAAVRAGKPVLCEKPLAPTVAECVEDDKAGGGLVSVGFMRRFDPAHVALKAALGEARAQGAGGALRQPWRDLGAWRGERVQRHRFGDASPLALAREGLTASAVADAVITSMRDGGRTVPVSVPAV